jgi:phage baseplate assembly protein V
MDDFRRALDPIKNKLRLMCGRAVLKLLKNAVVCQVDLLDGEPKASSEMFQQYGFRSRPKAGAEGIHLSGNGNRDHTLVFCVDDRRYQLDLCEQDGEVSIYTDEGDYFIFKRGRIAEMNTQQLVIKASTSIRFETPSFESTGEIKDNCDGAGYTMSAMRAKHNEHDHDENEVVDQPTDKPNQTF